MNSTTKRYINVCLVLIVFLGGFLRFWQLDTMPPALNWDEASHGYNAYSILKTGKDEWGVSLPLIFRAFGDYKLPVYIYSSILPIWLFGLNAYAVRFISALAGTVAIIGIYYLTLKLVSGIFQGKKAHFVAITAAFLLSINPWHFFISRPALEANLALTIIIFGFYFFLNYFETKRGLLTSSILLGLSLHTYNTARVFTPLLLLVGIWIYRKHFQFKANLILPVIIFISSLALVVIQIYSGEATARYAKLQILSESTVFQIGESRTKSPLPPAISRLVHNRPVYFTRTVASNYLKHFSPQFIYQTWGAQFQFAIPNKNLLTLPVYLLAIVGVYYLFASLKEKNFQFLLAWLLLSPLAASLTADPPQALRPNPMIPPLIVAAALGLVFIGTKLSAKVFRVVSAVFFIWIIVSFTQYLNYYFNDYKKMFSSSWQYGYSEVANFLSSLHIDYNNIFITKRYAEPHIFYSFYNKLKPTELQPSVNNIRFQKSDWFWTDKIDNVYFVNDWQIPTMSVNQLKLESGKTISTQRSILVTSPDHVPVNAHVVKVINFLNGEPAFIITLVP